MKTNFKKSTKYDQHNATYKQIIYLSNGKQFIGYSKKLGYNEKTDKVAMLKNWVLRMYNSGYLNPQNVGTQKEIDEIHYFLNDHIQTPLLCLNYDSYLVLNPEWATNNFKIIQFLDTYYQYIKNGDFHKITRLFDYKKANKLNLLDPKTKKFMTYKALFNWIKSELEKNNFTKGELTNFYNKYMGLHFPEMQQKLNQKTK